MIDSGENPRSPAFEAIWKESSENRLTESPQSDAIVGGGMTTPDETQPDGDLVGITQ